jgi:diketogulonate reductase-like aldo/keto reductase
MNTTVPVLSARGAEIPIIGFGTSQMHDCGATVAHALKLGYRHIDTAAKYPSEEGVGDGIRRSGLPRQELFVTTKVSHEHLRAADFAHSVDESLRKLRLDYVDLLLVHWPTIDNIPLAETMQALALAKRTGKTRHIGVANFNIALIKQAMQLCPEPLIALQAEYHPYLDQARILAFCRQAGLLFIPYCPLARGKVFADATLAQMARARGKSIAQIVLRWLVQQGNIAPIPRSSNPEHMTESLALFDFELSPAEMEEISALKRPDGRIANPVGRAPAWD